eukprot:TRINITY_DN23374_c0_g1_i1.p1 TRINITY_DN23374_c0_g1~~TRINITY_DN23374_c0_g1_i1.p1  ORF type:complete len:395 (-),score=92.49 TRINITY_DN23374_c0_g1_i1:98-1282(-)
MVKSNQWLILDTDAGVDDAVGICMGLKLAKGANFEVKLITTCFGNCAVDQVGINVAQCVVACCGPNDVKPKIVKGASRCLNGEVIDASHFHGQDGLGDAGLAPPPAEIVPPANSPNAEREAAIKIAALAHEAVAAGVALSVVTLGPLTNLALALKEEPRLPELVSHLVIMGCCGNGRGNQGRVTEFNVHADPEAAAEVFNVTWKDAKVFSWEASVVSTVPWPIFDQLLFSKGPESKVQKFLAAVCHLSYVTKRGTASCSQDDPPPMQVVAEKLRNLLELTFMDSCCLSPVMRLLNAELTKRPAWVSGASPTAAKPKPGAIICDAVAVAMALRPEIIRSSSDVHVEVELEGAITRGQTVIDWGTCFDGESRVKNVAWADEVDVGMFIEMLRETLQ